MIAAVVVMELSIVSLLLGWVWVVIAGSSWPAPWLVLLAAPLALVSGRRVPYVWRRQSWFDAVWWAVVAVLVAVLAEAGNALAPGASSGARWNVQFVAGLLLAWRGWTLADGWIDREMLEAELQAGVLVVLGTLVVLVWVVPGAGLFPAVTFAAAGLFGLGLARRAERRDPRASLESDWLVLVGCLVLLIVAVAVAVVALVTPEVLVAIVEQAQVAAVVAFTGLATLFQWLGSLFPSFAAAPEPAPTGIGSGGLVTGTPAPRGLRIDAPPFWVFELLLTFVGIIFLIVAGRAIFRLMRVNLRSFDVTLPRQREPAPPVSTPEAFSWGGWWRQIVAWLRGWLRGGRQAAGVAGQARDAGGAAVPEQRSVRALYRELLAAAARAGFERRPSTTPNELARAVATSRPTISPAIATATELYERARYGEERVGREELARMRSAVQQARRDLSAPVSPPAESGRRPTGR